ncbi:MAG: amidohydrolase family protein [bacterium]
MPLFAGRILLADAAVEGWLEVEGGRIAGWGEGPPPEKPQARGWIVPSPANAHTHVADAFLRAVPGKPRGVAELVGPGGWKQTRLAAATAQQVVAGVHSYADEMAAVGTAAFVDFREGGVAGASLLREVAGELALACMILGRPMKNDFNAEEAQALLPVVDGIGLSALRDFPKASDAADWAEAARAARKPFALHVSEGRREEPGAVLALVPSFVVHATQATGRDLAAFADEDVPIVVCPRSNAYYGLRTPVAAMRNAGVTIAVGTDNGMLQDGDLLRELAQIRSWEPGLGDEDLLRMMTWNGRRVARLQTAPPRKGAAADWIVLPERAIPPAPERRPGFAFPMEGPP